MLVLTRKSEEKIIIKKENQGSKDTDQIEIIILKVQGNKVSLGIKADKNWVILREELIDDDSGTDTRKAEEPVLAEIANN